MTRPAVADCLPVLKRIDHAEALRGIDIHEAELVTRFGADEVERMRCRHREALGEDQR